MSVKDSVFKIAAEKTYGAMEKTLCDEIKREVKSLNATLREAGINTVFLVGHNAKKSELAIQRHTGTEPSRVIESNVQKEILIIFSRVSDSLRMSSDIQHFRHQSKYDYTLYNFFKYGDSQNLMLELSEALSRLLTAEQLKTVNAHDQKINGPKVDKRLYPI